MALNSHCHGQVFKGGNTFQSSELQPHSAWGHSAGQGEGWEGDVSHAKHSQGTKVPAELKRKAVLF